MERITSRKNPNIAHIRMLARDSDYRTQSGEFVGDGYKLLQDAVYAGAEVSCVLWKEGGTEPFEVPGAESFICPDDLFTYTSPMANSPGPIFTVKMKQEDCSAPADNAIILENVQDPGNVGTVIRTANAFGTDAVILCGECADLYNPKTVRATMGAIFRQRVLRMDIRAAKTFAENNSLPLLGALLSERAESIENVSLSHAAVAVGSEGRGLSIEATALCDGEIIIPMEAGTESLNAAVAASVIMWEMRKGIKR